ncbi:uncharacterized protein LOC112056938 [Bicyclus anynana]|uniref:Uncharacterized protein LOC112056938 n=1 Tax=Bicyclus anynana TaxID=110368 RepID=A0ABM3LEX7_BICAN|nr:uncharacterized protein LOC112056938 [Bicyclus anynana]
MRLDSNEEYNTSTSRFSWLKDDYHRIVFRIKRFKWADLKKTGFILWISTLLFAITGLTLFVRSIIVLSRWQTYETFIVDFIFLVPRFALATSIFILIIATLGIYGAKSQKYKHVLLYTVLLVPILVFEIAVTVVAFSNITDTIFRIRNHMERHNPYLSSNYPGHGMSDWDNMQRELMCCGVHGNFGNAPVLPISCCPIPAGAMSPFECTYQNTHRSRCDIVISSRVSIDLYTLGCMGAVIASLQIIIIGLSAWMTHRLKHKPPNANSDLQKIVTPTQVVTDYSKF